MDIQFDLSDKLCLDVRASACTVLQDVCSIANEGGMGSTSMMGLCHKAEQFCAQESKGGHEPFAFVDARVCLDIDASADVCSLAQKFCAKGMPAADSYMCKRVMQACASL